MEKIKNPIFISLSPNVEADDLSLLQKIIISPGEWQEGEEFFEKEFQEFLGTKYAFSFNSGRSALLAILKSLDFQEGDEILVQAFTCWALILPILWAKLKPVFVDCKKNSLNLDPQDFERKITKRSKAVIIQHTFGLPADIEEIKKICEKHNLILIEDCAHALGAKYKGEWCGNFGKISFFSFGRDKVISSVFGGMVTTNDPFLAERINFFKKNCGYPSRLWIFQQLLHPLLIEKIVKPHFNTIGKGMLFFLQKFGILSKALSDKEKKGELPSFFPKRMPKALSLLASHQLKKLPTLNTHRNFLAKFYKENLSSLKIGFQEEKEGRIFLRFPIFLKEKKPEVILNFLKRKNIFLDDGWRKEVIVPPYRFYKIFERELKDCQNAKEISNSILNLPTHIQLKIEEAKNLCEILKHAISD
jgi:perosamine synthetase